MKIANCRLQIVLLAMVCSIAAGCSREIETSYGQRKGGGASRSVSGTAVLGKMFQQAGHRVFSWRFLSPRLWNRADCIVWFPDDFKPPDQQRCDWLANWLRTKPGRTLIYVGRDFDAAGWYWARVEPDAQGEQLRLLRGRMAEAKKEYRSARTSIPQSGECDWFTLQGKYQPRQVHTLQGPWSQGIDASRIDVELGGRIIPPRTADVLLESEGDVLVSGESRCFEGSQLIVVANGSFLLNLPLVNHEHRKLAGKLIDSVGPPSKTVVFLENNAGGPPISERDPSASTPTGWEILLFYPLFFAHLALAGIMFCLARWPIFGVPRQLPPESTTDFGKHIQALAGLLERSGDRAYAMTRVLHYQQTTQQ